MEYALEPSWEEWVECNLKRGSSPKELFDILIEKGFSIEHANSMLNTTRQIPTTTNSRAVGEFISDATNQRTSSYVNEKNNEIYLPAALKINNNSVEMYGVDSFLSAEECQHLIMLIRENRQRSTTTDEGVSEFRTSTTCNLDDLGDAFVEDIDRRICQYMGIDPSESEAIQGQWYEVGQEFKAHTDYFDPLSPTFERHIGTLGQRTWTFMIYLNSTREGGSTSFPELNLDIEPQAGTALIWNNKDASGKLNPYTLHHGTPVQAGYKAVITKWFRSVESRTHYTKTPNELIPPLTKTGFTKCAMPEHLHQKLLEFYSRNRDACENESIPDYIHCAEGRVPSVLVELNDQLRRLVHATLQPNVEAWVGDYVTPTHVYGIREYRRGSVLKEHRDRLVTHVASAILNIDQKVDEDWPLVIEDHHCRLHQILLRPGEMILYEGARLLHGRPTAFNGSRYANVFVHFKRADSGISQ